METPQDGETKVCSKGPGHMTKMVATPIYGKNPLKIFSRTRPMTFSVGAKSQILSSVAPPRKKNLATNFRQGHVLGSGKPMFY